MKLIGRWCAGHEDYELLAPPQELVGQYPTEQKRAIVEYIYFDTNSVDSFARMLDTYFHKHRCVFGCGTDWTGTSMHISDGEWVWPVHLAHYVQQHDVMLPEQFIQHALRSTDEPKFVEHLDRSQIDDTYWLQWCRENRSYSETEVIQAIRDAQDASEASRLASINEQIKKLERESGICDTPCRYSGCSSMALSGKAFCAKCIVEKH